MSVNAHILTRRALGIGLLATPLLWPARAFLWPARRAKTTASLTIMGFYGAFETAFRKAVITPFLQDNPGITLDYRPVANSAQAFALLRLQRDHPEIDVSIFDISVSLLATHEGLLEQLDSRAVPNVVDIPEWGRPEGSYGVALSRDNLALIYSPAAFSVPPKSWLDLARPDLVDQVSMPIADTRGVVLLPLLDRIAGVDYRESIDPALKALRKIAPNVATWNAQPDIYTLVLAQTVSIGVGWNGRGQMIHDQQEGEIKAIIPREGSISQINTIGITAGTPRRDLARAFVNYALSPEAQARFAQIAFYGPTNSRVSLTPALSQRIFGDEQAMRQDMHLDWSFISHHYNAWIRRIQREVISD